MKYVPDHRPKQEGIRSGIFVYREIEENKMTCARVYHGFDAWPHCTLYSRMFLISSPALLETYCRRAEPQVRFKKIAEVSK